MKTPQKEKLDKQEWISGDEGRRERLRQVRKELELLRSPRGREYAAFLGENYEDYLRRMEHAESIL